MMSSTEPAMVQVAWGDGEGKEDKEDRETERERVKRPFCNRRSVFQRIHYTTAKFQVISTTGHGEQWYWLVFHEGARF